MTTTTNRNEQATPTPDPERDALLRGIAAVELGFTTLEERKSDRLDFREVSVWGARVAQEWAYEAGRQRGERDAGR